MSKSGDVQRRTWNKEEYEERAREREALERAGKKLKTEAEKKKEKEREELKPGSSDPFNRTDINQYNVKEMIGKRRIVSADNALGEEGGFYCEVCDHLLKDHKSYLEHCNKPRHLQKMGFPVTIKKAGVDDIRERLALHKKNKEESEKPDEQKRLEQSKKKALEALKAKGKKEGAESETKKTKTDSSKKGEDAVQVEQLEFDPAAFGFASFGGSAKN